MIAADKAKKLAKKYQTRDPFELCVKMGVEIVYTDIGTLKGMYTSIKRNRFIVINQNLDVYMKRMVCAHELAHDQLHREISSSAWIKDFEIYENNSKQEYEANIFVSELLVNEVSLIDLIKQKKQLKKLQNYFLLIQHWFH